LTPGGQFHPIPEWDFLDGALAQLWKAFDQLTKYVFKMAK
jgi:hypothetical protein